jgi:hypothetical protein
MAYLQSLTSVDLKYSSFSLTDASLLPLTALRSLCELDVRGLPYLTAATRRAFHPQVHARLLTPGT